MGISLLTACSGDSSTNGAVTLTESSSNPETGAKIQRPDNMTSETTTTDWLTNVHNLNLLAGGNFIDSLTIDLALYDAGTDSAAQYPSTNPVQCNDHLIDLQLERRSVHRGFASGRTIYHHPTSLNVSSWNCYQVTEYFDIKKVNL